MGLCRSVRVGGSLAAIAVGLSGAVCRWVSSCGTIRVSSGAAAISVLSGRRTVGILGRVASRG